MSMEAPVGRGEGEVSTMVMCVRRVEWVRRRREVRAEEAMLKPERRMVRGGDEVCGLLSWRYGV